MSQGSKRSSGPRILKYAVLILLSMLVLNCTENKTVRLSYGAFVESEYTRFRVHAPDADQLYLVIFNKVEDHSGKDYPMEKNPTETGN